MHYRTRWFKTAAILLLGGCSNVAIMDLANQDLVSPAAVTQFKASTGTNQISLRWVNPADKDFKSVRIIRKAGAYPSSQSDGAVIYEGADTSAIDAGTTNLTEYYYSAYAVDSSANLSAPAKSKSASCSASIVCPSGYILVGANEAVNAYCQFCVAQYEMRNVSSIATSQSAGTPWASVTQDTARTNCANLGAGYHLIRNSERMAILREIEAIATNWSSGIVGNGALNRGWTGAGVANGDPWVNTNVAPSSLPACLYNTAADTCGASGTHTNKRTHSLSSGAVIWDLVGNLAEWLDWNLAATDLAYTVGSVVSGVSFEYTNVRPTDNMPYSTWQPLDTTLTMSNGIGLFAIGGGSQVTMHYGTHFDYSTAASGIYALSATTPGIFNSRIGFRCAYAQ